MIVGIGVDVLAVGRVERELRRDPDGFRAAVFTAGEIAECEARRSPARHYAARFAAKEALLKALDAADRDAASWREVEVRSAERGAPRLELTGRLAEEARRRAVRRVWVSLSHDGGIAAATVVLDGEATSAAPPTKEGHSP